MRMIKTEKRQLDVPLESTVDITTGPSQFSHASAVPSGKLCHAILHYRYYGQMIIIVGHALGVYIEKDGNCLDFMGFIPHVTKIIVSV